MLVTDQVPTDSEPSELTDHLRALIKPELETGERLLWAEQPWRVPIPRSPSGMRGAGVVTLSFLATSLGLMMARIGLGPEFDFLGVAAAVGFLLVLIFGLVWFLGAVVLGIRHLLRRILRRPTYALTDRRAIIWLPMAGSDALEIRVFSRGSIRPDGIRRIQRPDGSGDLLFVPSGLAPNGFLGVEHVRQVESLVRRHLVTTGPVPEVGGELWPDYD